MMVNMKEILQLLAEEHKVEFSKMIKFIQYGLRNHDLIQGTLRISEDSPNEAFIEFSNNPKSRDVMILGIRDRNRAQDGDIVVAKLKDRSQWIVREMMYESWLNGSIEVSCDEDGLPLTVPPVKVEAPESEEDIIIKQAFGFLPFSLRMRVNKDKLKEPVPVSKNMRYGREAFLRMGMQLKIKSLEQEKSYADKEANNTDAADKPIITPAQFNDSVLEQFAELSVNKPASASGDLKKETDEQLVDVLNTPAHSPLNSKLNSMKTSGSKKPHRRVTYRFLADLDDEDWAVPNVCLQKTAKVMFVAEPNNHHSLHYNW